MTVVNPPADDSGVDTEIYGLDGAAVSYVPTPILLGDLWFLILDLLTSISTAIAGRVLVWSLATGAGAMLVGVLLPRAFCGYVCPLGTLFDRPPHPQARAATWPTERFQREDRWDRVSA